MKLYGLIGYPLGHSFSEKYFSEKFVAEGITDAEYRNFPLESIKDVPAMIAANPDLEGFNVTIPYKREIIPFLKYIHEEARAIGAVNCVKVTRYIDTVELTGYNTDVYGFYKSLLGLIGDARPDALVLGTGGSSKAVGYVLDGLGIKYKNVSRTAEHGMSAGAAEAPTSGGVVSYGELSEEMVSAHKLIVNCTPLGTFPKADECPALPYEAVGSGHFLFDLVYNPPLTEFLRRGAERGAKVRNGYEMLVLQAEKSWQLWVAAATPNWQKPDYSI